MNYCHKEDRLETIVPGLVLLLQVRYKDLAVSGNAMPITASNAYRLLLLLLQLCGGKSLNLNFFLHNANSVVSYLVVSTSSQWHRLPGCCTFLAPWNNFNSCLVAPGLHCPAPRRHSVIAIGAVTPSVDVCKTLPQTSQKLQSLVNEAHTHASW